ncbi:DDE-type integrase/transposase/recombinase [Actinosynnema sp. NPDC059797]
MNGDFSALAPNRLWVADATRISTGEDVFWLAAVRDALFNRTMGWKPVTTVTPNWPFLGTLEYAIWSRDVRDGQLILHSDSGSTYTAFRFTERLADNGILLSVSSVDDSHDSALMDDFLSTLKIELVCRRPLHTRDEADNELFHYSERTLIGWLTYRFLPFFLRFPGPCHKIV